MDQTPGQDGRVHQYREEFRTHNDFGGTLYEELKVSQVIAVEQTLDFHEIELDLNRSLASLPTNDLEGRGGSTGLGPGSAAGSIGPMMGAEGTFSTNSHTRRQYREQRKLGHMAPVYCDWLLGQGIANNFPNPSTQHRISQGQLLQSNTTT
jgi:hypothetical protein